MRMKTISILFVFVYMYYGTVRVCLWHCTFQKPFEVTDRNLGWHIVHLGRFTTMSKEAPVTTIGCLFRLEHKSQKLKTAVKTRIDNLIKALIECIHEIANLGNIRDCRSINSWCLQILGFIVVFEANTAPLENTRIHSYLTNWPLLLYKRGEKTCHLAAFCIVRCEDFVLCLCFIYLKYLEESSDKNKQC